MEPPAHTDAPEAPSTKASARKVESNSFAI